MMTLRELLRLSTGRCAGKVADTFDELARRYRRYQLLNRISCLYRDRKYFDEQVRAGLSGLAFVDREIAIAEADFRKLK